MAFKTQTRFGITMFPTDYSIAPVALALAVEERGFDSLFFPEHTHIPACRTTAFPGGTDLPKMYWHTHDPFVALAACAAVTNKIRIGTGICLIIERDPIILAKEVASLDTISNGRFVFGIGAGWNREEMENHGADFENRWSVVREKVLAMRAIWTQEEAQFHGKYVNFDPLWSYPKPVQPGGPPIWVGANSKWVFDRVAEYADGWMPIGGLGEGNLERMRQALHAKGRKLEDLELSLFGAPRNEDQLKNCIEQGFDTCIFNIPSEDENKTLARLDKLAALVASL